MTNPVDQTFAEPAMSGAIDSVQTKVRDLDGRIVVATVTSVSQGPSLKDPSKLEERVVFDVIVVDNGQPLFIGGGQSNGFRPTHTVSGNYQAHGIMSSHVNIVRALKPFAGTGQPVLGRIERGVTKVVGNNAPWNFGRLTDQLDPATAARMGVTPAKQAQDASGRQAAAAAYSHFVMGGANVEPTPIGGTPASPTAAAYVVPAPVVPTVPTVPTAVAGVPAGYSPEVWAQLSEVQRQTILAAVNATASVNSETGF